jgi:hypothetical protein
MDDAKQQLTEKLQTANNVLVTVSRNPSVDQLASCIGLTLLLNKQGKHAAAVFSGQVPSTLEFLQPEETLEKNTDSLRDFIIALDKSKADKLRYKVEDNVVRIFITPYKTSISQDDLEFSEGDFNVDVVVALGVLQQEDLDEAITAHGRILHDAAVTSINLSPEAGLGVINWSDPQASSLSELVSELAESLGDELLDTQIATALLTGIVSETDRFSNDKTTAQTMSVSAELMAAGANQQLVASKLEEGEAAPINEQTDNSAVIPVETGETADGTLRISHVDDKPLKPLDLDSQSDAGQTEESEPAPPTFEPLTNTPSPDDSGDNSALSESFNPDIDEPTDAMLASIDTSGVSRGAKIMTEPPSLGGQLTANSSEEALDPTSDPLSLPSVDPPGLMAHKPDTLNVPGLAKPNPVGVTPDPLESLSSIKPSKPALKPAPSSLDDLEDLSPLAASGITSTPTLPTPPPSATAAAPSAAWLSPPTSTPSPSLAPSSVAPSSPSLQPVPDTGDKSLADLEKSIGSPHAVSEGLDTARDEVNRALAGAPADDVHPDAPLQALSAQPLGGALHDDSSSDNTAADAARPDPTTDASSPPPVPPPIPFQFGSSMPPSDKK